MTTSSDPLEQLWDALLSRQPDQVRKAFQLLSKEEQNAVFTHLQRMSHEPGWHPEQTASATAALDALLGSPPATS